MGGPGPGNDSPALHLACDDLRHLLFGTVAEQLRVDLYVVSMIEDMNGIEHIMLLLICMRMLFSMIGMLMSCLVRLYPGSLCSD